MIACPLAGVDALKSTSSLCSELLRPLAYCSVTSLPRLKFVWLDRGGSKGSRRQLFSIWIQTPLLWTDSCRATFDGESVTGVVTPLGIVGDWGGLKLADELLRNWSGKVTSNWSVLSGCTNVRGTSRQGCSSLGLFAMKSTISLAFGRASGSALKHDFSKAFLQQ